MHMGCEHMQIYLEFCNIYIPAVNVRSLYITSKAGSDSEKSIHFIYSCASHNKVFH